MRKRFYRLVEPSLNKKDPNYYFDIFIMSLIVFNVLMLIIASEKSIGAKYSAFFYYVEVFSVIVFTIEYLIRVWACVENSKYEHPISGRIKFMFSPMAIVDLLAILPFYLPLIGIDLRFIRLLRLFRVFRLFKMARYMSAIFVIKNVFKEKKEELVVTLFFIIIVLVTVSTLMFYIERDAQPEAFASIPRAIWWGVVTLTTVGYGDVYPVTAMGKVLGGIITILGVGLIALPSGILASGYTEQIQKRKADKENN